MSLKKNMMSRRLHGLSGRSDEDESYESCDCPELGPQTLFTQLQM